MRLLSRTDHPDIWLTPYLFCQPSSITTTTKWMNKWAVFWFCSVKAPLGICWGEPAYAPSILPARLTPAKSTQKSEPKLSRRKGLVFGSTSGSLLHHAVIPLCISCGTNNNYGHTCQMQGLTNSICLLSAVLHFVCWYPERMWANWRGNGSNGQTEEAICRWPRSPPSKKEYQKVLID